MKTFRFSSSRTYFFHNPKPTSVKPGFHSALFFLFAIVSSCSTKQDEELKDSPLLGEGFGISTATILVKDLDSTRNYFTKVLGFKMPEKFQKGIYDGTLSAAVSFADFSAIELLSLNDTGKVVPKDSFITSFLKQDEGVRLYSFFTSSVDTTRNWLHTQRFKIDTPRSGRPTTATYCPPTTTAAAHRLTPARH